MSGAAEIKHTALSEMEAVMREKLEEGGSVSFSPKGKSMLPMLRSSGDSVSLVKPPARIKKGTVALFISKNEAGERIFVLHRLVRIRGEKLIFCGDARFSCDEPASYEDVIGVVEGFETRGRRFTGNELRWRLYRNWMIVTAGFRTPVLKLQNFAHRVWKKLRS